MIYGIGTDIVRVARMRESLERHGEKFARRLLTPGEFEEFQRDPRPAHFLAKRFAAKEATAKALGTGFASGLSPRHIGVTHDANGKPILEYLERAAEMCLSLGIGASHVSISDEEDHALAFVTLLTKT
jgi:holo-[acyl-carrier protein] synthase